MEDEEGPDELAINTYLSVGGFLTERLYVKALDALLPKINKAIAKDMNASQWRECVEVRQTQHGYDGLFCKKTIPIRTLLGVFCGRLYIMPPGYQPISPPESGYNITLKGVCTLKITMPNEARKRVMCFSVFIFGHGERIPLNGHLINHSCDKGERNCLILDELEVEVRDEVEIPPYGMCLCEAKVPWASATTSRRVAPNDELLVDYGDQMLNEQKLGERWVPCNCKKCKGTGLFIQT